MKRLLAPVLILSVALTVVAVRADQGMWMPQQIPQLAAKLKSLGFQGDPKAFADLTGQPMGAVVSLGGCTASFVSPEGLLVTNHHCVTGALQFNSTPQRDLLTNGYLAKTREEELPAGPGSRVFVTTRVTDVTEAITGGLDPTLPDRQRYDAIDVRLKERVAACEKQGLRCSVPSFFEGLKYFEIAQLEIRDVRLVYSPHEGIGVFGGETDNWRWPRHTGDWSFYRAYVGKDGQPATFSKDNVPYHPKHWLPVAAEGVKPDDLVFVVGYPGRTQRHQTHAEVKATTDWSMPRSIRFAEEQLAILDALSKKDKAIAIKVAGRVQGLNNGLTNTKGVLEGLVKGGSLERKQQQEKELASWIDADPARKQKYGDVLPAMQALHEASLKTRERNATLGLLPSASSYLGAAQTIYRLSLQRPKPDIQRDAGYQERDWSRIREGQDRLQRTIDPTADRALLRVGDGQGCRACRRPSASSPSTRRRGSGGHGRGGGEAGDRPVPRIGCMPGRSWPTATSGWACWTRARRSVACDQGSVHRAGCRARAARRVDPGGQARPSRALTPGCGRATWKRCSRGPAASSPPTPTARCG